jgi:sigma-B regulation protein RsbU (phosphoserine phosphatase)
MIGLNDKKHKVPKLSELINVAILQQIQDWASETAGVPILIRDAEGNPVTTPSMSSEFCNLIAGRDHTNPECRKSNIQAAVKAFRTGKPQKYTCHAGLTQFAAPIEVEKQFIGTIVVGDRPTEPLKPEHVLQLADKFGIHREKLIKASQEVEIWSDETMNSTINFLYSMANTLFGLCYQGYSLNRKVRELTALLDISKLLTSVIGLQEVLDRIAEGTVRTLGVEACTIRLLDDDGVELTLSTIYNLSEEYLSKGPVILEEHPVCQAAIKGESIVIKDVRTDPRFRYHEAARTEGLCSMLCVGLRSRDKAIGTIHLYTDEPHDFTEDEIGLVESIASQAAVAIENAKLYEESLEKQRMEQELAIAGEIQSELLPNSSPQLDGIDVKAMIVPYGQLSGDLYDFIALGDGILGIVIADVSGKGAPGAILMATTRVIIRTEAVNMLVTKDIIDRVNRSLCEDTRPTEFVSMFYGVLDAKTLTFTYTNAGHNPPILFRGNQIKFLEEGGIPLGIIEDVSYDEGQIQLVSGDLVLLYTDGVTETMNEKRDIFGLDRLLKIIQRSMDMNAQGVIDNIYQKVINFADGEPQSDDLTLMVLKFN